MGLNPDAVDFNPGNFSAWLPSGVPIAGEAPSANAGDAAAPVAASAPAAPAAPAAMSWAARLKASKPPVAPAPVVAAPKPEPAIEVPSAPLAVPAPTERPAEEEPAELPAQAEPAASDTSSDDSFTALDIAKWSSLPQAGLKGRARAQALRPLARVDSGLALADLDLDTPPPSLGAAGKMRSSSLSPRARWEGAGDGVPTLLWSSEYVPSPVPADRTQPRRASSQEDGAREEEGGDGRGCEGSPAAPAVEEAVAAAPPAEASPDEGAGAAGAGANKVEGWEDVHRAPGEEEGGRRGRGAAAVEDFEILHMIGEGGFGKVYQVRRRQCGQIFAMKCMRKKVVLSQENIKGTKAERSIMSALRNHPYIITMHFAFQCEGRLYLIMDYLTGGQFLDLLHHHAPFDPPAARFYCGEIALALEELHTHGVVHRDLKPENILVSGDGHAIVTDFGCSKVQDTAPAGGAPRTPIRTQSWAGTELYMAPEQLMKAEYGQEVDWWALGALAWEMCTGDHPFYSNNRKAIHHNILRKKLALPAWLSADTHKLLKGLLTRDPAKRLGAGDAPEVKAAPFFSGLDFAALRRRELPAPLRSHAATDDPLDVSGHAKKYTGTRPELSPLLSPLHQPVGEDPFSGFSWNPAFQLPPPVVAAAARGVRSDEDSDSDSDAEEAAGDAGAAAAGDMAEADAASVAPGAEEGLGTAGQVLLEPFVGVAKPEVLPAVAV